MTKKKLILGILVFAFGIMITACGSKSNTSNTAPANPEPTVPKSFDDASDCGNCVLTFDGQMAVLDDDLYLQAFGYARNNDLINVGNDVFSNLLGSILAPAAGVLVCGSQMWLTEQAARLMGITNIDFTCTQEDINIFGNGNTTVGGVQVADHYNTTMRVEIVNNQANRIRLDVDNSSLSSTGGDDFLIFSNQGSGVFRNSAGTLILQNANGRVRFATSSGRVIGEFSGN